MSQSIGSNTKNSRYYKSRGFRDGTPLKEVRANFLFSGGGCGDYIHWTPALLQYKKDYPHVAGDVFVPPFFRELAELWIADDRWKVWDRLELRKKTRFHSNMLYSMNGNPVNALGVHLYDCGFLYLMNKMPSLSQGRVLPPITGEETDISAFELPEDYVVIPAGATEETRQMPAETLNEISKGIRERGLTPVYLGKKEMTPTHTTKYSRGVDWSLGLDLRDSTSILEAACIMAKADCVLGIDSGLLHLASCSSVPVIFSFTTVSPDLRVTHRPFGRTEILVPPPSLECRFCASEMRGIPGLTSKKCLYEDLKCLSYLTPDWFLKLLDDILEE